MEPAAPPPSRPPARASSRLVAVFSALAVGAVIVLFTCGESQRSNPISAPRPAGPGPRFTSVSLKTVVEQARLEGEVVVAWNRVVDEAWRRRFEAAFQEQYGFRTTVRSAVSSVTSGATQPRDVVLGSAPDFAALFRAGALGAGDWDRLFGVPERAITFNAGAFSFAQRLLGVAYNATAMPSPPITTWDQVTGGRWARRLGLVDDVQPWVTLSALWGEDRTATFVQGLARQQPRLGSAGDLLAAVRAGDLDLVAPLPLASLRQRDMVAAGLGVTAVTPLLFEAELVGPLKQAPHPNAALLFAGFLATQEGQDLWLEFSGESSLFVAGSPAARTATGQLLAVPDETLLLRDGGARAARYAKLLGI